MGEECWNSFFNVSLFITCHRVNAWPRGGRASWFLRSPKCGEGQAGSTEAELTARAVLSWPSWHLAASLRSPWPPRLHV